MSMRRKPNPNRNHPLHCPYCSSEDLFPNLEGEFAWKCHDCLRIFSVMFHGQDDPEHRPAPADSTAGALRKSLEKHNVAL
ncbi:hypothetical protein [Corynebacterium epidermidicanis]|uniref:Uncharacterized protein n=1 Tax=Corynebacterium epidermidicanis TaxID=1050174 RepID=A0A0G3GW69_9CORY|nr:hypothetical protein [Corynebacterium epidermidicanis]AKK03758.1 hypothetical protein CEPID_09565 [Corynebacterium epidermidicanis]